VPLTAAAALGALVFGHVEFGVTASIVLGSVPAVLIGSFLSSRGAGPLHQADHHLRDLRFGLKYIGVGTTALGWTLCAVALGSGCYWLARTRPWANGRLATAPATGGGNGSQSGAGSGRRRSPGRRDSGANGDSRAGPDSGANVDPGPGRPAARPPPDRPSTVGGLDPIAGQPRWRGRPRAAPPGPARPAGKHGDSPSADQLSGSTQMPRSCMSLICLSITSRRYSSWAYGARSR